jgi:hypothetical protein
MSLEVTELEMLPGEEEEGLLPCMSSTCFGYTCLYTS